MLFRHIFFIFFGYLIAKIFGSCPLKWRKNRYWLLIIIIAVAYWLEYVLQFITTLHHEFTCASVLINILGAITGIFFSLKRDYQRCRCKYIVQETKSSEAPVVDFDVNPLIHIGHNPALPPIIAKTFGWKELEIKKHGFQIGFICTGKGLISYPHISYGNIRFTQESDYHTQWAAMQHYLHNSPFYSVEMRLAQTGPVSANGKVVSLLELSTDPWLEFTTNLRRKIRKSQKNGFTTVHGGMELLDDFYCIYASHIRSLGSAPLTRKWFQNLLQHYQNGFCGIFLLKIAEEPVGAAFNLAYQNFYENSYFAVLKPHQHTYGSYALTYAMIEHARTLDATTYSFGRSTKNSGVHQFKQQWNTTDIQLNWLKYPKENINLRHHTTLNKIWKNLPIPLRKPLDSYISKWIY